MRLYLAFLATVTFVTAVFLGVEVQAQCTELAGSPPPTSQLNGLIKVRLRYGSDGPGGNDDKIDIQNSEFFVSGLGFDPAAAHSITITLRRNNIDGTILWSGTLPSSSTLWTSGFPSNGNVIWRYKDPAPISGVRRALLTNYDADEIHRWRYIRIAGASIGNAPLMSGIDQVHLLLQIANGGIGFCYDGVADVCTGSGKKQTCVSPWR